MMTAMIILMLCFQSYLGVRMSDTYGITGEVFYSTFYKRFYSRHFCTFFDFLKIIFQRFYTVHCQD